MDRLARALVERSADQYEGWGDVVLFAACTAARIGEVSGVRVGDIDTDTWTWTVRRQTTPGPGGLVDKGTKGKRARKVPIIAEIRELVLRRMAAVREDDDDARLFYGPRGGRIMTAVLRDATHWDQVSRALASSTSGVTISAIPASPGWPTPVYRFMCSARLRGTGRRYLHPDLDSIAEAGRALSAHLTPIVSPAPSRIREEKT